LSETTEADIEERLRAVTARHLGDGLRIDNADIAVGGGSNRTWTFDAVLASGERLPLILRQETYAGPHNIFESPAVQYEIMAAAYDAGVPVPKTYYMLENRDGLGAGFVMERIDGETIPRKILRDAEYKSALPKMAAQCGDIIGTLQAIDLDDVLFLGPDLDDGEPARVELEMQRRRLDDYQEPHPAFELGLRWLEQNLPKTERTVVVHGDFRNGNFIVGPEGIRSVLDWELAHIGSPAEDFGWLGIKSWRFGINDKPVGGFGDRRDLYDAYEARTGFAVDEQEVFWWEVYGVLKWGLINLLQAFSHLNTPRRSVVFAACGRNVCQMEYDLLNMIENAP
jgi:aminoglycoside phosphotransferase (APT) family kinase protein